MNKKIHSLALLVNLGIYGVAQAQEPTDTPVSHDDTIVVTAAEQNLQAPGVSTITADEIRKNPVARDVSEIIRTMPGVTPPVVSVVITARLIFAAWVRKTR